MKVMFFSVNKQYFLLSFENYYFISYQLQFRFGHICFSLVIQTGSVLKYFFLVLLTTEVIKKKLKPGSLSTLFVCDPDFVCSFLHLPNWADLKRFMIMIS